MHRTTGLSKYPFHTTWKGTKSFQFKGSEERLFLQPFEHTQKNSHLLNAKYYGPGSMSEIYS